MDEIDSKIQNTLSYIKSNPGCNTNPHVLDCFLVKDLESQGLIDGINVTSLSSESPEFIDLRLNIYGEKYLSLLQQPPESDSLPHWHSNPFLVAALALVVFVAGSFIVWYAGWLK